MTTVSMLVDISFKLISDFCHVNSRCFVHAEQASSSGVFEGGGGGAIGLLNKGGGSNRLPVEFPQVQTSRVILYYLHSKCFDPGRYMIGYTKPTYMATLN